ncbi:MAG: alpha/beta hydrolase [candidate division WOR-3 bacterium]|nr:MAG: alpha/beta hydrolase [candidate division WOR-3 bacterium]
MTEKIVLGTKYTIRSEILGTDRSFIVNPPEGYESTELHYPVLYVLDAEYFYYQSHGALQFLSECGYNSNRPVPQMILVAVLDDDRNRDFTPTHAPVQGPLRFPTSGGAAAYLEHVEKELRPFIDANFRTSGSILAGWSLGGLFAFYTFLEKPELFASYIAISPSLWWNNQEPLGWVKDRIPDSTDFRQKLVITQGALEGGDIGNSVKGGIVPLLEEKKMRGWAYVEIPGVSHNYTPYTALYEGLQAAFPDFAVPQDVLEEGLDAVKEHYSNVSAAYGYAVNVPDDVYAVLVQKWRNTHDPEETLPITAEWTATYPRSAIAWYFHGRMHQLLNDLDMARECFQKAVMLEQARILPDSEWLNAMRERIKDVTE